MSAPTKRNVKWIDGLRGFASISVVVTHLTHIADAKLFLPQDGEGIEPRVLQYPFIRVFLQGRLGVAFFGFVTGYVCVLKPTRLGNAGEYEEAYRAIADSCLRRVPRLVLPAVFATMLMWLLAELGLYFPAKHVSSDWLRNFVPARHTDLFSALYGLGENLVHTWTRSYNYYDFFQWTLFPLCKCALHVLTYAFATVRFSPRARVISAFLAFVYFWSSYEQQVQMPAFFGVLLCQIQNYEPAEKFLAAHSVLCRIASIVLLVAGLWLGSLPEEKLDDVPWSHALCEFVKAITPGGSDIARYGTAMCACCVALSIHLSPFMRDLLSNRFFLWLGKQSFAVYLLHNITLKTVLTWMVFGIFVPYTRDESGKINYGTLQYKGHGYFFASLLVYFPATYALAVFWMQHVDPYCAELTKRFVNYVNAPPEPKKVEEA